MSEREPRGKLDFRLARVKLPGMNIEYPRPALPVNLMESPPGNSIRPDSEISPAAHRQIYFHKSRRSHRKLNYLAIRIGAAALMPESIGLDHSVTVVECGINAGIITNAILSQNIESPVTFAYDRKDRRPEADRCFSDRLVNRFVGTTNLA